MKHIYASIILLILVTAVSASIPSADFAKSQTCSLDSTSINPGGDSTVDSMRNEVPFRHFELPICGNGICQAGESCNSCQQDCGCGIGNICAPQGSSYSCQPSPCSRVGTVCSGSDYCCGGLSCRMDQYGMGTCAQPNTFTASCGDHFCSQYETCSNCAFDCGTCVTEPIACGGQPCTGNSDCCAGSTCVATGFNEWTCRAPINGGLCSTNYDCMAGTCSSGACFCNGVMGADCGSDSDCCTSAGLSCITQAGRCGYYV